MGSQFAPDTADGWSVLHQFFHVDWQGLRGVSEHELGELVRPLTEILTRYELYSDRGQSAAFHILGATGQLLLLHFRPSFDECAQIELSLAQLPISRFFTPAHSFVSVVELGMYHTSKKIIQTLQEQGLTPHSDEWREAYKAKIEPHRENLHERCYTEIPDRRYISFYPMSKRRGETYNWYAEPLDSRAQYMMEHGMTGRRYAGKVQQIISGAVGFDNWEWGVDLFADDPSYFKQLVYEMRFDDATSRYGDFGDFYLGIRLKSTGISQYFSGVLPEFQAP
ncbi:MAG: heme-dependent peroxidase [Bdellovibrionales bacterium]|nr:heme-dependent peroxidase [Bdellovibrionales bacterium]